MKRQNEFVSLKGKTMISILGRFFAATVLTGFVLREIWEMAQMSAYVETAAHSWTSTLGLHVGDCG